MGQIDLEQKMKDNLAAIRGFTLMDDTFMTQVFSNNKKVTEFLLREILGKDDLQVVDAVTQMPIANIYGKSVRLKVLQGRSEGSERNVRGNG